jgi:putative hydrolase of the HAD superfamily
MKIKRIYFDSGKVLIYPKSGHWFYPQPYFEYCEENRLHSSSWKQKRNFKKAYKNLTNRRSVPDVQTEKRVFLDFYTELFSGIKGKNNQRLISSCAEYTVNSMEKYLFYPDVEDSMKKLSRKYKIGMITDAWPSVLSIYQYQKLDRYFDPFIISTIHGHDKSGYELFQIAINMVDEEPEEILFVDDSSGNLDRAAKLGMQVFQLNRDGKFSKGFSTGRVLADLEKYLS